MYPSNSNGYDNHSDQKPAPHGQPATVTGVPVNPNFQDPPPTGLRTRPINNVPWSHGLFDCFSDMKTCCISLWCPCITFGRVAEIMDEGSTSCGASGALYALILFITGCPCCYSCFYRSKMRNRYQLQDHPCNDCLVHCFCETCALTQEYRELERRGFDMSIGWQANMIRQSHGVAMGQIPPGVQGGMTR